MVHFISSYPTVLQHFLVLEYVQLPQIANTKSEHVVTSDPNDWVVYTKVAKCQQIKTEQFYTEMQKRQICQICLLFPRYSAPFEVVPYKEEPFSHNW